MFLPKYINSFFKVSKINGSSDLVKSSSILYETRNENVSSNFLFSPLVLLGLIASFILFITYKDYKKQKRTKWLDITLFSLTGVVGILLLFLWFGTDHTATWQNYNLLWAFPLNIFAIRLELRNRLIV